MICSTAWTTIGSDQATPWAVDWDTTTVPDGVYDLHAIVTDGADNQSTSTLPTRVVDNTAPTASRGAALLLARAVTPEQQARVGDQTGGRVSLFLETDDFWDDYRQMQAHGVRFVDVDRDGRLDLSLTNNDPGGGGHPLWRNTAKMRGRSIAIDVTDRNARRTRAGSEVRAFKAGTRELLTAALVDSGSGYC